MHRGLILTLAALFLRILTDNAVKLFIWKSKGLFIQEGCLYYLPLVAVTWVERFNVHGSRLKSPN